VYAWENEGYTNKEVSQVSRDILKTRIFLSIDTPKSSHGKLRIPLATSVPRIVIVIRCNVLLLCSNTGANFSPFRHNFVKNVFPWSVTSQPIATRPDSQELDFQANKVFMM
jgi:hypothetical protein